MNFVNVWRSMTGYSTIVEAAVEGPLAQVDTVVVHDTLLVAANGTGTRSNHDIVLWGATTAVTILIAAIGWHRALQLSRQNFRDKVRDHARLLITRSLADYQLWLVEIVGYAKAAAETKGDLRDELISAGSKLAVQSRGRLWLFHLSEHEAVFPETREIGKQLSKVDREIAKHLNASVAEEGNSNPGELQRLADVQNAMLNELRTYLQNVSLGKLYGREVLPPSHDDRQPLLRVAGDGQLRLDVDVLKQAGDAAQRPVGEG